MAGLLLINPRSGAGGPTADELAEEARSRGVEPRVLRPGDDAAALVASSDAEIVGMASGDGSLAAVAAAAMERDVPFVCVPFGTRNHFARDAGLDRDDPVEALAAFADGAERVLDVGRVNGRVFLNNVSLGLYARLVHRREEHRRRRDAFARLRALALTLRDRGRSQRFVVDGRPLQARVVLVANNAYALEVLSIGERERLDAGRLHLYVPRGLRRVTWEERSCTELRIDSAPPRLQAAVDGEPVELEPPLDFRIDPQALRLLVPRY